MHTTIKPPIHCSKPASTKSPVLHRSHSSTLCIVTWESPTANNLSYRITTFGSHHTRPISSAWYTFFTVTGPFNHDHANPSRPKQPFGVINTPNTYHAASPRNATPSASLSPSCMSRHRMLCSLRRTKATFLIQASSQKIWMSWNGMWKGLCRQEVTLKPCKSGSSARASELCSVRLHKPTTGRSEAPSDFETWEEPHGGGVGEGSNQCDMLI